MLFRLRDPEAFTNEVFRTAIGADSKKVRPAAQALHANHIGDSRRMSIIGDVSIKLAGGIRSTNGLR